MVCCESSYMLSECRTLQASDKDTEGAELRAQCASMETELRRSKRREEKLQAMQFRLREDLKACGGDLT